MMRPPRAQLGPKGASFLFLPDTRWLTVELKKKITFFVPGEIKFGVLPFLRIHPTILVVLAGSAGQ